MRTQRVLYNVVANIILLILRLVIGLIIPRLYIEVYGSAINGLNASISQVLVYLNIVEAGIGMASIQALYSPLVHKDWDKVNGILSATDFFYKQSGVVFLFLIIGFSLIFPFIIHEDISKIFVSILVLLSGTSIIIDYFFHSTPGVLLVADQRNYVISIFKIIATVIEFGLSLILILSRKSILLVQVVIIFTFIIRVILIKSYISRKYTKLSFNGIPDKAAINKRWDVIVHEIGGLVFNGTDIILITLFCNLTKVSIYSIYNYIFGFVSVITTVFSSGIMPALGHIMAEGDHNKINNVYRNYEFLYFNILFVICTITCLMILPFIRLYTAGIHDANYIDKWLPLLFFLVRILNGIRASGITLINSAGHFKETKYRSVLESCLNLTTSIVLIITMGIYGVLFGTIIALLYRTIDVTFYSNNKILKQSCSRTFNRIGFNFILSILMIVLFQSFIIIDIVNWAQWVLYSFIISCVVLTVICGGNALREPKVAREILETVRYLVKNSNLLKPLLKKINR